MKLIILVLYSLLSIAPIFLSNMGNTGDITTIYIVRHAEKVDDSTDPELSDAGKERALKLAGMLEKIDVDAIYSTNYKRTLATVRPTSHLKEVEVQLYDPRNEVEYERILEENIGKIILIAGHSNTVPMAANFYLGEDRLEKFDESDYGNFLILMVKEVGDTKLIHLTF